MLSAGLISSGVLETQPVSFVPVSSLGNTEIVLTASAQVLVLRQSQCNIVTHIEHSPQAQVLDKKSWIQESSLSQVWSYEKELS